MAKIEITLYESFVLAEILHREIKETCQTIARMAVDDTLYGTMLGHARLLEGIRSKIGEVDPNA